jgi:hypothetical protein
VKTQIWQSSGNELGEVMITSWWTRSYREIQPAELDKLHWSLFRDLANSDWRLLDSA